MVRKQRILRNSLTVAMLLTSIPFGSPLSARSNLPGVLYWHGDPLEKKIALTFDDGPNEPYTSEVLDILRQENVHATFFMTGSNVEAFPETAREVVREGHAVGNHSFTHRNMVLQSSHHVRDEIERTADIIEEVTGMRTNLFRPPFGGRDFFTLHESRKLGLVMVEWTVSAQDWRKPGVNRIVSRILRGAKPGAIVLMHDGDQLRHGSDRSQTVASLPIVIRELRRQGYQFVTVPELLKIQHGATS